MSMKRLYRSADNRLIGGVCGGLGDYFDVDPVLVRLVWLILILFGGIGLLLYLVGWLIIPEDENVDLTQARPKRAARVAGRGRFWWGILLVVMGVYLWGSHQFSFIIWPKIPFVSIQSRDLVPFILILVGIYVLYTFGRPTAGHGHASHGIYRSRDQRKIAGVCGGLAEFFKVDPTLVRVLWVAGALLYGATVLLYLILMIALPEKKPDGDLEPSGD